MVQKSNVGWFFVGRVEQPWPLRATLLELLQRRAKQHEHGLVFRSVELFFHDNQSREREHPEPRPVDLEPITVREQVFERCARLDRSENIQRTFGRLQQLVLTTLQVRTVRHDSSWIVPEDRAELAQRQL